MIFKFHRIRKSLKIFHIICVLIVITLLCLMIQLMYVFLLKKSNIRSYYNFMNNIKTGGIVILTKNFGNFEPQYKEHRTGPGENGAPYILPENLREDAAKASLKFGMNIVCSDHISLNRTIPDTRQHECKYWTYSRKLPSASVIIVLRNEGLSVILRTINSVINRTPPELLREFILVDDCSDTDFKEKLAKSIEKYKNVRLITNYEHEGLIESKNIGAYSAKGEVIVFLDAHCEVNINWLPPLLAPIYSDATTLTVPIIDTINENTFEYKSTYPKGIHYRGIFEWGLLYKETIVPQIELNSREYDSEPYKSPTHSGWILAINREYFYYLSGYDHQLNVQGVENFDLSFKVWLCGGRILWVPCSRVGHIYSGFRNNSSSRIRKIKTTLVNYKRIAETWFDDKHKQYFYTRHPFAAFETVDITEQLEIKERLKCKNFEWYMKNIAYDVYKNYPELPPNLYYGKISLDVVNSCLVGEELGSVIKMSTCLEPITKQFFRFNVQGQLTLGEWCVVAQTDTIKLDACKIGTVDGPWTFESINSLHPETQQLRHTELNKCLTFISNNEELKLLPCSNENVLQHWVLRNKKNISDH